MEGAGHLRLAIVVQGDIGHGGMDGGLQVFAAAAGVAGADVDGHLHGAGIGAHHTGVYFDEVTAAALATRGYRWLFDHPTEDRFTGAEFVAELDRQGLQVRAWRTYLRGHYLLGAAERPHTEESG